MFSRYWTEIIVIGILPLLTLICLNYGIYLKIRKSAKFRKLNDGFIMRFSSKKQLAPKNTKKGSAKSISQQDISEEWTDNEWVYTISTCTCFKHLTNIFTLDWVTALACMYVRSYLLLSRSTNQKCYCKELSQIVQGSKWAKKIAKKLPK